VEEHRGAACELFKGIAWQKCGYEIITDAAGEERIDKSSPILKCVCCGAMANKKMRSPSHQSNCTLKSLLGNQKQECNPPAPSSIEAFCEDFDNFDASDTAVMAEDLQDILQIPASSFGWLQEDMLEQEKLLSRVGEEEQLTVR